VSTGTFHGKFFDHLVKVRVLSTLVFDADDTVNKNALEERTEHVKFSIFTFFILLITKRKVNKTIFSLSWAGAPSTRGPSGGAGAPGVAVTPLSILHSFGTQESSSQTGSQSVQPHLHSNAT